MKGNLPKKKAQRVQKSRPEQGDRDLYKFDETRQVVSGRVVSKNGKLQGQGSRPEKDRSIGSRGGFTNKEQGRGRGRRNQPA